MVLDPSIAASLRETHAKLTAEGKLLTAVQLNEYYSLFRSKFGPDALRQMDGEALLSALHDHSNRSSLAYWLEFKDDEELPGRFGSIAGGSALKFRVYKSKDGEWTGADERNYPVAIPLEKASAIAREHRDELIAGAALLEALPNNASDEHYAELQKQLDERAPNVSDLAWGHKYFSLLFHEKLDDFHVTDYQHFHLIKMLIDPPRDDEYGRYMAAGRFVAIAKELAMPMNHLTGVLNVRNGRPYWCWRIGTSDNTGKPGNRWNLMKDGGCVAIGWSELGDLSSTTPDGKGKEKIKDLMAKNFPDNASVIGRKGSEVFTFVRRIKEGDIVVACHGATALGIGRVTGQYYYQPGDFAHRRLVDWLDVREWSLVPPEGLQTTVHEIKAFPNRIEVERKIIAPVKPAPLKISENRAQPVPRLSGIPGRIQSVLERKGQVILYGPPGTGKTFWALRAARDIAAYSKHGVTYDNLSISDKGALVSIRICTFHPNFGYEDFIEGYRPIAKQGQLIYELRDGLLKSFCSEASQSPNVPHILIIDEVNRGDIPRVFGELITLLEKDKRGQPIDLPLSGKAFSVPANVFIIGTMNTADRSIALLDTALRRRFGFIELMPDASALGTAQVSGLPLAGWLTSLNRRVREHLRRDGRNLQIGHSYLMDGGKPIGDFAALARAIREDILPLLIEYCYEDFDALISIVGEGLVDKNEQKIREDLFDSGSEEDLLQALLSPDPEVLSAESMSEAANEEEDASELGNEQT